MKSNAKRLLCLMFVIIMTFAVVSGCSDDESSSETSQASYTESIGEIPSQISAESSTESNDPIPKVERVKSLKFVTTVKDVDWDLFQDYSDIENYDAVDSHSPITVLFEIDDPDLIEKSIEINKLVDMATDYPDLRMPPTNYRFEYSLNSGATYFNSTSKKIIDYDMIISEYIEQIQDCAVACLLDEEIENDEWRNLY